MLQLPPKSQRDFQLLPQLISINFPLTNSRHRLEVDLPLSHLNAFLTLLHYGEQQSSAKQKMTIEMLSFLEGHAYRQLSQFSKKPSKNTQGKTRILFDVFSVCAQELGSRLHLDGFTFLSADRTEETQELFSSLDDSANQMEEASLLKFLKVAIQVSEQCECRRREKGLAPLASQLMSLAFFSDLVQLPKVVPDVQPNTYLWCLLRLFENREVLVREDPHLLSQFKAVLLSQLERCRLKSVITLGVTTCTLILPQLKPADEKLFNQHKILAFLIDAFEKSNILRQRLAILQLIEGLCSLYPDLIAQIATLKVIAKISLVKVDLQHPNQQALGIIQYCAKLLLRFTSFGQILKQGALPIIKKHLRRLNQYLLDASEAARKANRFSLRVIQVFLPHAHPKGMGMGSSDWRDLRHSLENELRVKDNQVKEICENICRQVLGREKEGSLLGNARITTVMLKQFVHL